MRTFHKSTVEESILRTVIDTHLDHVDQLETRRILLTLLERLTPRERENMAQHAIQAIREELKHEGLADLPRLADSESERVGRHLTELRNEGITLLGPILDADQVKDVHQYLAGKPVYGGANVWNYCDKTPSTKAGIQTTHCHATYKFNDLMESPHLLETIGSPFLLKLVEQYLGVTPTVYQSSAYWSFPNPSGGIGQEFHRDYWDGLRYCTLFIYLTDVNRKTGAHHYIRKSHRLEHVERSVEKFCKKDGRATLDDIYFDAKAESGPGDECIMNIFQGDTLEIERPAGYAFLSDTFGFHRGLPVLEGERLIFFTRYALYDNGYSYYVTSDPLKRESFNGRIPNDARHRYMFRPLIESEFSMPPTKPLHTEPKPQPNLKESLRTLIGHYGKKRFITQATSTAVHSLLGLLRVNRSSNSDSD